MTTPNMDPRAILDDGPLVSNNDVKWTDSGAEVDLSKANGDMDYEDDDEDDEKEDMEKTKKSLPDEDDLVKALAALEATGEAATSGTSVRQTQLAAKAAAGEDLSKSERAELVAFLEDDGDDGELAKSHMQAFAEDAKTNEGFEVSSFLEAFGTVLAKGMDSIRDEVRSGRAEDDAFKGVLAKSVAAMGRTIAAQSSRIEELEGMVKSLTGASMMRPQAPKAKTRQSRVGQSAGEGDLAKSAGGDPAQLDKTTILNTIDDLIKSADTFGGPQHGLVNGVDLTHETSKYESTGILAAPAMKMVMEKRGIDPKAFNL